MVDRMILDVYGNSTIRRIERRPLLGDCPAPKHPIMFQTKVPVQSGTVRRMFLYDK